MREIEAQEAVAFDPLFQRHQWRLDALGRSICCNIYAQGEAELINKLRTRRKEAEQEISRIAGEPVKLRIVVNNIYNHPAQEVA